MGNLQVDKATYEAAKQTGMEFEILEPIKVKGKEGKQEVFRPTHDAREVRLEAEATAMMEGRVVTEDIGDEIGEDSAGGNGGGGENGTSSGNAVVAIAPFELESAAACGRVVDGTPLIQVPPFSLRV